MAKELLQEADQGREFDMSFVGMQIVKHTRMVAELEAMQNFGSPQFQQLVSTAAEKTQEHLKMAKDLSKKLSNGDGNERPEQSRQPADRGADAQPRSQNASGNSGSN